MLHTSEECFSKLIQDITYLRAAIESVRGIQICSRKTDILARHYFHVSCYGDGISETSEGQGDISAQHLAHYAASHVSNISTREYINSAKKYKSRGKT